MGLAMALVQAGLDVPAQEDTGLDFVPLDQIDDLASTCTAIGTTTRRTRDFDLPAAVDHHAGAGVGERLHAHLGLPDGTVVGEVGGVAEHDVEFVEDAELLEAAGRGGFAVAEDRVGRVDGNAEGGGNGRDVDGLGVRWRQLFHLVHERVERNHRVGRVYRGEDGVESRLEDIVGGLSF